MQSGACESGYNRPIAINRYRQRGFTMGGWVIMLLVLGLLGILGIKMVDIHLEKLKIQAAVKKLEPDFNNRADVSEAEILVSIDKKLIADFVPVERREELKKKLKFKRLAGELKVILQYEIKRSFMFGYELSKIFTHEATIKYR